MRIDTKKLLIHMARKKYNFTTLACASKVSRATLSYINGGKSCRPDIVAKIAAALDVDVTEILESGEGK